MGKNYKQIKKEERNEISILLNKHYSIRDIAKALKRNPGTISREINNNSVNGQYDPEKADHKAYVNRKYAKYQGKKINENKQLKNCIIDGLMRYWSPDDISGRMIFDKQPFYASKTNIYEWLYNSIEGYYLTQFLYSQRRKPRKQNKDKPQRTLIPNRISIDLRPNTINHKREYGHYEGDTIVSGKKTKSKTALSVIYERKAQYCDAEKINNLKPETNNQAITSMADKLNKFKSFTLDNGIENTKHEELKEKLNIDTYFCKSYSPWQKGGVENINKQIRRFIPKGTNIGNYSEEYVERVIDILNNKPRKSLNYQTPMEAMIKHNLLKPENNKKTSNQCLLETYEMGDIIINKPIYQGVALRG